MQKIIRGLFAAVTAVALSILGVICYFHYCLPSGYYVERGTSLTIGGTVTVGSNGEAVQRANATVGNSYSAPLRWMGIFPIKTVSVTVVDESVVVLGGTPFGVKLYTDGVLVVSMSEVDTAHGNLSPARNAGLRVGDLILSINDQKVYTNEEVARIVKNSAGKTMTFRIKRDGIESNLRFCAAYSRSESCYKAGIWVRDSSAGIGTLTFYDPKTRVIAGLGHAVCDVDTGEAVPISSGELVPARIYSVDKSEKGTPGELRGGFGIGSYGTLLANGNYGVYGYCEHGLLGQQITLQLKQNIKTGNAKVYTTVSGSKPDWYDIRITQIRHHDDNAARNMVIEITDERLLSKTGGIVQGMSGSPVVQDGKLVGAVTHVFVNDPTKGYAIFAENMLEVAKSVGDGASTSRLKDAS